MGDQNGNQIYQEVALRNVRVFAYHGFYPEEQILGNEFWVSATLRFNPSQLLGDQFVNYEILNQIIQDQMRNTQKLLETVVDSILQDIRTAFSFADFVQVEIKKSNPPFGSDLAQACVALTWTA